MGSKKTKTTTNSTQTPVVTEPYKTEFSDFTKRIGDFLDVDPTQFVAPPSSLQMRAFGDASNLGGWEQYLSQAQGIAGQAAGGPASRVTATGYNAPEVGKPTQYGGANLGPAAQMSATGYQAPTIDRINGPQAYGARVPRLGNAPTVNLNGYGLPMLGGPSQVGQFGYNAPRLGDAALASSEGLLGDAARIRDYMDDYQNPYTSRVIDATLADYDEDAGRRQAQLAAQGAKSGAFGGSRFGIAEGTLAGELARGRASTEAALLDQQYRLAAELGGADAGAANQFALTNAGMGLQTNLANQAARNQFSMAQAGLDETADQFNASNAFQSALANQNADNQFSLAEYGAGIDASRYGADAANQGQLANQDMAANFAAQQFGADTSAAQQYADALNNASMAGYQGDLQTSLAQAGMDADASRYFADAANQAGANNMAATNNFALQQGLLDQQTGQYNTDALNNFRMTQTGLDADAARYQADATNQANFQNANLQEQQYLRQLQSAGLLGDLSQLYSGQSLADLGMTADLGSLQRSLEAEYLNAIPTQLQLAGSLYGGLSPAIYSGAQVAGKSTSKESGGLLPTVLGAGLQAAAATYGGPGWTFSDPALKSNIVKVGEEPDGLGIYEYNIFGRRERGVMADEVAELRPWALGPTVGGFMTVDYSRL